MTWQHDRIAVWKNTFVKGATNFLFVSQLDTENSTMWFQDVGLWLEEINLGSYRQVFEENRVNGEYLESLSMFTTEQILRFIRRCHMKWGDFITLCKELRRIKGNTLFSLIFSWKSSDINFLPVWRLYMISDNIQEKSVKENY